MAIFMITGNSLVYAADLKSSDNEKHSDDKQESSSEDKQSNDLRRT